ncbi:MAG: GDSL-type esterase/lipase family protein [bacterium]
MSTSPHRVSRARGLAQNLGLTAATIIGILVVLEVGLSLAGYGDLIIYKPDDTLYWRPKPNQTCHTKVGRHPVTVNSHGTRGEEFSTVKPPGDFRILCVGDSRTFGWGLADGDTYPAILQDSLRALAGDMPRVEVINAGVNGWSWSQVFAFLRDTGLSYDPDVIVVADAYSYTSFTEDRDNAFVADMRRRVWFKNLLRRSAVYHYFVEYKFRELYHRLGQLAFPGRRNTTGDGGVDSSRVDTDEGYYRTYVMRVCELLEQNGVPFILLHLPTEGETSAKRPTVWNAKYDAALKYGVPFVDVTDAFLASKEKLFLQADPLHQNAAGNRIIAGRLFQVLEGRVRR